MSKSQQLQIRVSAAEKALIQRKAAEAGMDVSKWVLRQILPPEAERFQALCAALISKPGDQSYTIAEFNDFFARLSEQAFSLAVNKPPRVQLPPFEENYIAAMVAHTAALKTVDAPRWIGDIKWLELPWFASPLKNLRLHLLTRSPPAFRSRNLFIDSSVGSRI